MTPINERLRHANLFMKGTASLVLAAFLSLTLQPLALAANTPAPARAAPKEESTEEKLGRALHALTDEVERLEEKLDKREDTAREDDNIKRLSQAIDGLDVETLKGFDEVARHIRERNLPPVIMERHTEAVNRYRQHIAALKANVTDVVGEKDRQKRKAKTAELKRLMEKDKRPARTPLDPNKLPFRIPEGKVRKPKETAHELRAAIAPNEYKLASATFDVSLLAPVAYGPPSAADLAPTEDAQITAEIRALAAELGHNPVKIYNWVHNNIRFLPTYGSIQGSHLTLLAKQGNAFDTASLLIALLRASNIHARYVYGTVELPIEKAMNWVGGVKNADATLELLAQGGIPSIAVIAGGRISAVRIEHVWVEAHVDFYPSRGAIHKRGDTWVPMDGSFKEHLYTEGVDVISAVPFDGQDFINRVRGSAQTNSTDGSITGIDADLIRTSIRSYSDGVRNYLDTTKPNATLTDLFGGSEIRKTTDTVLPHGLPYKTLAIGDKFPVIPDRLRHKVKLAIYASKLDIALDSPDLSYSISLPKLGGKRLGITYAPTTAADSQAIKSYREQGAPSLPIYTISVMPLVQVDGVTVTSGSPVSMGQPRHLVLGLSDPLSVHTGADEYTTTAGDEIVVGLNGNGVTPDMVQAKMKARVDTSAHSSAAENLYQAALHFWMEHDLFDQVVAEWHGVHRARLPSAGLFSSPLSVSYLFGIPWSGNYKGRQMDVKRVLTAVAAKSDKARFDFMTQAGIQGSYLEGSVFDQLHYRRPGTGLSAAQLLMDANQQRVPIYTLTRANIDAVLPLLQISAGVKDDIQRAVAAGKTATVSQREIQHGSYSGVGYILQDPATGSAAYLIDGGASGGVALACAAELAPIASAMMAGIAAILAASLAATTASAAAAAITVTASGVIVGSIAPIIAFVAMAIVAAILVHMFVLMMAEILAGSYPAYDDCSCNEHLNRCLESGWGGRIGFDSVCVACRDRCVANGGNWPDSIPLPGRLDLFAGCGYWNAK